ncbi:lipase class 3 [Rhizophagus clarus]|uniref:sn-1-specific diacylglycerol lipase n=1 Tax=Rhizophagus clarus TaxID=94130 RepID=A0A8H3LU48_9GLOM|nr:lipase class 3 [Rhizophagus clarus]
MPIQEENNDIFTKQEVVTKEDSQSSPILSDDVATTINNCDNIVSHFSLIPPPSEKFQPQDLTNLTLPVRRRKRPQNLYNKDVIEPENVESVVDSSTNDNEVTTSLVLKSHSDLALTIDRVTTASRAGLDLASIFTGLALEAAKLSTKASLGIAKTITGVMSDRLVQTMSNDGSGRIIGTSTNLLHRTLTLTEQIALAGLEFTSDTIQFAFGTADDSLSLIDTFFGTTDAAKALAEFVQLVKREFNVSYEKDDNLEDSLGTFGAFRVIKSLTAWACLQYVTNDRMERRFTGWKKVKLVDISDMYDWVYVSKNETEENIYDELEFLLLEEEEGDEEMVIVKSNKSNNIVIGELTPKEEIPEFRFSMSDERSRRLSDIYLDATKRLSNPYLEEFDYQTKDEKLFSLLHNLKRYSKFSSSAYDFKTAIIGKLPFPKFPIKSPIWKERGRLHRFTFASNTDLPFDSIVDSSHTKAPKNPSKYQPSYFIIRDHTTESIILALRGTMSIHDLIVDLTCEYEDFQFPEDIQRGIETKHKVHKGIFKVAKSLAEPGQSGVYEVIKRELEANEGYGLVLVGHSLGAGVASLLAILLASPKTRQTTVWSGLPRGRRVHAYAFATPCVMSAELSKRVRPLVTSVAYGNDVVCRLSVGHVKDLRDMVRFLGSNKKNQEGQETASKILKKILDYQSRTFNEKTEEVYWIVGSDRKPYCDADDDEGEPDGELFEKKNCKQYNMLEIDDVQQVFNEIWFSPHMMIDHFPYMYENVLKKL